MEGRGIAGSIEVGAVASSVEAVAVLVEGEVGGTSCGEA